MSPAHDFVLTTARTVLRIPEATVAPAWLDYLQRNAEHFASCSPRAASAPTLASCEASLRAARDDYEAGRGLRIVGFLRDDESHVLADIGLSNIVRGPFQACHLGYRLDRAHEGRGYMREMLRAVVAHAFESLRLHRIMANYVPTNERSGRVLRSLGFQVEGYARDYLKLDGVWKDHLLTSLVNPDPHFDEGR
jgi:ribosomal-protein-alanine N-acetyltransferase